MQYKPGKIFAVKKKHQMFVCVWESSVQPGKENGFALMTVEVHGMSVNQHMDERGNNTGWTAQYKNRGKVIGGF
jgi:hypothetical protein